MQDEWTRVRRKGRRSGGHSHPWSSPSARGAATTAMPSTPGLSLREVQDDHQRIADQWKSSVCCRQLDELIASRPIQHPVSEAICLGLGSFDPADGAWEVKRRAHVQLAAFLSIVEQIQSAQKRPIRCVFQEPCFTPVDKSFLESLGHQVVDSPEGFNLVSPAALVFGVHLYRNVYSEAIAQHTPSMFVGTPYAVWDEFHGSSSLDWARMKEVDQLCDKAIFPEDTGYTTFSSTSIHWCRRHET
ncbi:hypothetical protein F5X99DRAFT_366319 [Biscogniauxia marginata]|nr:hypothetical protein F5X99DRAFT_366319 [Biscogniauxia marginata]